MAGMCIIKELEKSKIIFKRTTKEKTIDFRFPVGLIKMKLGKDGSCLPVVFIFLFIFSINGEFVKTIYTAELRWDNVAPTMGPEGAKGLAICVYDRNAVPKTLDCEVEYFIDPVHGPFYAGIFKGQGTATGPLIYEFTVRLKTGFFRQIFSLSEKSLDGVGYSLNEQEDDFLNGRWFLSIYSEPYDYGAIRGQLLHQHFSYAKINDNHVLPKRNESQFVGSAGLAVSTYSYYHPRRKADFTIVHNVANPIGINIHRGNKDQIGPVDSSFVEFRSPVQEEISYIYQTEQAMLDNEQYININSFQYPLGEIRGQIHPIDYLPPVGFTARIDSLSVRPPTVTKARGCGLFSIDCTTMKLDYLIFHSVTKPTRAFMNFGSSKSNGNRIWELARAESPIYGSRILSAEEIISFYKEELYITVESFLFPVGEIRGQITDFYDFYAYLSGSQVVPPVTTSGMGCATFRLKERTAKGTIVDYDIHFQVSDPVNVNIEIMHGDLGSIGESLGVLDKHTSPAGGTDFFLTETEESFFGTQRTYVQIGDYSVVGGRPQIRGHIYQLANNCPFVTSIPEEEYEDNSSSSWDNYAIQGYIHWNSSLVLLPNLLLLLFAYLLFM